MTKLLSSFVRLLVQAISLFLPASKRMRFRSRVYNALEPYEPVMIGGRAHRLFVPDRTSIYWILEGPDSEPVTNRWIESMAPDDVLVDVGANVGFFSLYAAAQGVRRVMAIEPNPLSFNALCLNIVENGYEDVIRPLNLAVLDETGWTKFAMSELKAGSVGNFVDVQQSHTGKHLGLAGVPLDFLMTHGFLEDASHLKIDVDGLDFEVLQSGAKFLERDSLKSVLIEDTGAPEQTSRRDKMMADRGFRAVDDFGAQAYYTIFTR